MKRQDAEKLQAAVDKVRLLDDQVQVREVALAAKRVAQRARADASDETMAKRLEANRKRERGLSMKDDDDADGPADGIDLHEYKRLLGRLAKMKGSTVEEEHKMLVELARAAAEKAEEHEKNFGSKEERKDSFLTRRRKRVAKHHHA
jgi:hypothetical protein